MRRLSLLMVLLLSACNGEGETENRVPVQTTGTIVFVGDSITQGWPLDQYLEGAVNAGVSGNETPQMRERFFRDVLERRPALVVIHGGINDIRNRATTDCGSLLEMVQMARAANVEVIVGTLMLASRVGPDASLKKHLIRVMNDEIRAAADSYGFEVADYYRASVTPRGLLNRGRFPDGLHPNQRGYDAMWEQLRPKLDKLGLLRHGAPG